MATVQYNRNSPYFQTETYGNYLDVANFLMVPKSADDVVFTINKTYQFRPDLLAFDLYGDAGLWWVFAMRNPNSIEDPVFDMKIGRAIYLPKKDALMSLMR
jgi:hypothetical protein